MDAKARETNAPMRTTKACGPGIPWLMPSLLIGDVGPSGPTRRDRPATVTNKVMDTGESAQQIVNTIAQGMPMLRLHLWRLHLCAF